MGTNVAVPAALLFTQQELGGPCQEVESTLVQPVGTFNPVVLGNGDRVGLLIMNVGNFDVSISITPQTALPNGILLPAGGGVLAMNVRDDFTLPTRAYGCASPNGIGQLYVLEIIRFTTTGGS